MTAQTGALQVCCELCRINAEWIYNTVVQMRGAVGMEERDVIAR
jgi:hypothetical protein